MDSRRKTISNIIDKWVCDLRPGVHLLAGDNGEPLIGSIYNDKIIGLRDASDVLGEAEVNVHHIKTEFFNSRHEKRMEKTDIRRGAARAALNILQTSDIFHKQCKVFKFTELEPTQGEL